MLKAGVNTSEEENRKELSSLIRIAIGATDPYTETCVMKRQPNTRSDKILRGAMRTITDGEIYPMPSPIDDPTTLSEIADALKKAGYGHN